MQTSFPFNKKEQYLFVFTIAFFTSIPMLTTNLLLSTPIITINLLWKALIILPCVWIAMLFVFSPLIINGAAAKLMKKYTKPTDSFYAQNITNIFFCVTMLSFIFTLVFSLIFHGFTIVAVNDFLANWPRNFMMAFFIELFIAQPLARLVMRTLHKKQFAKQQGQRQGQFE